MRIAIALIAASAALYSLPQSARAADALRLLAQVSHVQATDAAELKKQFAGALKKRGVRYSDAKLAALAEDCAAKARAIPADKLRTQPALVCADSAMQFQIQVGTSDLQNAENVRSTKIKPEDVKAKAK